MNIRFNARPSLGKGLLHGGDMHVNTCMHWHICIAAYLNAHVRASPYLRHAAYGCRIPYTCMDIQVRASSYRFLRVAGAFDKEPGSGNDDLTSDAVGCCLQMLAGRAAFGRIVKYLSLSALPRASKSCGHISRVCCSAVTDVVLV